MEGRRSRAILRTVWTVVSATDLILSTWSMICVLSEGTDAANLPTSTSKAPRDWPTSS